MEKEVIFVPKGKSPWSVIEEMKEKLKNSWLFLHRDVVKELRKEDIRGAFYYDAEREWQRVCFLRQEDNPNVELDIVSVNPEHHYYLQMA